MRHPIAREPVHQALRSTCLALFMTLATLAAIEIALRVVGTGLGADTQFELIRDSPPTFSIKLTKQREIAPDVWVHPDDDRRALAHGQFTASALLSLRARRNRA